MTDRPVAFADLPGDHFPLTVEFLDQRGRVVHSIQVSGPGAMDVPGLAGLFGPITVRTTFANGRVIVTRPDL